MPVSNDALAENDVLAARYRLAVRTAIVAGAFALVVCAMLGWDYTCRLTKDPLESPEFAELKSELAKDPRNEPLKEQIRRLDLRLRRAYFTQREFTKNGIWLLLGAMAVLLAAARWAATLGRKLPQPLPRGLPQDPEIRIAQIGRWAVAALGVMLACVAVALSQGFHSVLERGAQPAASQVALVAQTTAATVQTAAATTTTAVTSNSVAASASTHSAPAAAAGDYPSDEEYHKNWPRFRGPDGSGISGEKGMPTAWSGSSGKGIVWKTAVPLPGHNSPVVWGDRVFLSGADMKTRKVFCLDAVAGKLLWQKDMPSTPESTARAPKISEDTGYAAPTMATDGRRAYAIFANGDVGAMDFQGNVVWARSLGIPNSSYGFASSLATYKNLLLIQFDQGSEAKDNLSKAMALDGATGKPVWETRRPVPNSWPSPIVIHSGGRDQYVTAADPWVIAYDPANGKELWRANCLRQDVGPSPVFRNGVVYVVNQSPCLSAIRADGQGDVTKTHVLWSGEDNLPDICSPLATDDYVLLESSGTLTSYDAKTGKKLWEKDLEGNCKASPGLVGKNVYLLSEEGKMWIVEPGPKGFKEIGTAELGEACTASPAFHNGRIYLRGAKNLYCIGGGG